MTKDLKIYKVTCYVQSHDRDCETKDSLREAFASINHPEFLQVDTIEEHTIAKYNDDHPINSRNTSKSKWWGDNVRPSMKPGDTVIDKLTGEICVLYPTTAYEDVYFLKVGFVGPSITIDGKLNICDTAPRFALIHSKKNMVKKSVTLWLNIYKDQSSHSFKTEAEAERSTRSDIIHKAVKVTGEVEVEE